MTRFRFVWLAALLALLVSPGWAFDIERVKTPLGIEVWLVQDHTNPIITLNFAFRGGSTQDPKGKEGATQFAAALLDEGAGDIDANEFHRRLEDGSFSIGFGGRLETISGDLRTLRRNREEAFDLLRLALSAPRFDPEPVARVRNQILVGLRQAEENPAAIAGKTLYKAFFPDHPYGRPGGGEIDTVTALTVDDLRAVVKNQIARDNLILGVVGDTTPDEIAKLIDSTFGGLPAKANLAPVPDVTPKASGGITVIKKPVPQSNILFAHNGVLRKDPDFYPLYVMNYVLGGGNFGARLFTEVREKRGLAYSINTSVDTMQHAGVLEGGAGTANPAVAETVRLVREEWRRIAEEGITEKELEDAKLFLTGSYALQFSSSGRIASALVSLQLDDLGIDFIDRRNALVNAVTLEKTREVAKRRFKPDELTFVVVGEPAGLQ
jgi:zinc protease